MDIITDIQKKSKDFFEKDLKNAIPFFIGIGYNKNEMYFSEFATI